MPLTLVLGPANSAKARVVLGAHQAQAPRGALLVVPTAADARHYGRELAAGSVLGAVVTFGALAAEIARRADYAGRRLTELQRQRVLARVLARADLPALRDSARAPGFRAAAGALISELQSELVEVGRFRAALRAWAAQDVRRAAYARDLGRIYADYRAELERSDRVDADLYAWRAVDALRAAPAAWGDDPVLLYGFDDLSGVQRDAVATLAGPAGADVTVSLTYEPGRDALAARAPTVEALRPFAAEVVELEPQDDYYAHGSRAALHQLERRLFVDGAERVDAGDAVRLLEAGGERAEAELVAAEIGSLLDEGVPADQIAVLHRSPDALALAASVLERYGMRVAGGGRVRVAQTPLGRALAAAGRCAWEPERATAADLLAYLRAPGLADTLIGDPALVDALDATARRRGLRTAAEARSLAGAEPSLARLDAALHRLDTLAAAEWPGAALCALGRELLAAPHQGEAALLTRAEAVDAAALSAVVAAVSELSALGSEPSGRELPQLLGELELDPGDESGGVLLADPISVRARRFRVVFVCGLQEGEFPRGGRVDPFLSDERRRELASASGLILPAHEDTLAAERYLFYAAVSRATERVYLSYRSCDEEGNLELPSPFIADVAELLSGLPVRRRLLSDVVWDADRAPTAVERARALAAATAPVAGDPPEQQRTLGAAARERLRHMQVVSAGALETYGDCPVKWLVESQLSPRRLAPDEAPLTRGSVIHAALEAILSGLGGPVTPASEPRALELLAGLMADLAASGAGRSVGAGEPAAVRAGALRAIEAALRRYLEHEARTADGGWTPLAIERRFGFADEPESLPALELAGAAGGTDVVRVRGVIDRIDVDPSGRALVRDYKSGAPRPDWPVARWSADRRLQVALYMLVASELERLDVVGGVYQPLGGEDLRARGVFADELEATGGLHPGDARTREQLRAELEDAAARAVALAARLRAGEITPCPATCSRGGCAHPAICRSQ